MDYYNELTTQKSWQILTQLRKDFSFILIGDWAVFLYAQSLKSKDIDLVLEFTELEKMRQKFAVTKNERLKKYEARAEEAEIDLYLPFYSNPGLPAEEIKKWTQNLEGFLIPQKEVLLILKLKAYSERKGTVKGRKDLIDIVSLLNLPDFDWLFFQKIISLYRLDNFLEELKALLKETFTLEELDLNRHQFSRLKKKWLAKLGYRDPRP